MMIKIIRQGVPMLVHERHRELSAKARAMCFTEPTALDYDGQLSLPIPDTTKAKPTTLDFGTPLGIRPRRCRPEQQYVMSETQFGAAIKLQHQLYKDGHTAEAQALWDVLATVRKA